MYVHMSVCAGLSCIRTSRDPFVSLIRPLVCLLMYCTLQLVLWCWMLVLHLVTRPLNWQLSWAILGMLHM